MIDASGKVVVPLEYKEIEALDDGCVAVRKEDDKWGLLRVVQ